MISVLHSRMARGILAGHRACLIVIVFGIMLIGSSTAFAQSIFGSISGTVVDPTGAVVPGAKVSVTNNATNVVHQAVANKEGYFVAGQLPVGTYNVSVAAKGFESWNGTGIELNASDEKTLTIPLKVGAESQTVEVTASSGTIDIADSGARKTTIDTSELERMPLVGRNAMEVLSTIPGAAQISNSGTNRPGYDGQKIGINGATMNGSAGGMSGVSINGQAGTGLSMNIDGQNVEDPGGPGSATPVNPNPDMLSEVTIQTSNYGADNAKGPVVINTLSKSGGSAFHGDFHFFARNSALNAEESNNKQQEVINGYTPGYLLIPNHYYYPGFTVGGPVIIPHTRFNSSSKTKFFFHEAFEEYKQLIDGGINDAFLPTANMIHHCRTVRSRERSSAADRCRSARRAPRMHDYQRHHERSLHRSKCAVVAPGQPPCGEPRRSEFVRVELRHAGAGVSELQPEPGEIRHELQRKHQGLH